MTVDARAEAWVRLHCAGYSTYALATLLRHFGTPDAVLGASAAERARIAGRSPAAKPEGAPDDTAVAAALAWLDEEGHALVTWDHPEYPAALLQLPDPPVVLYAIGNTALLNAPSIAVVGSRNATPGGCADALAFAEALAAAGLTIVSGLALGIDGAAHRGALAANGATVAVLGTGADRVYPAQHRDLARAIADKGLLVTEFLPGTPPHKSNFPRRNRIISGLARGVLVIEATLSSGSLITARLAAEQGREVFAVPGSIHSMFSRGCHRLIRDGAKLVEKADDVLEELGLSVSTHSAAGPSAVPRRDHPALRHRDVAPGPDGSDVALVARTLAHDILDIDGLVERSALPSARVTAALTMLEIEGRVARLPGGAWQCLA